jgi:hypothetical protein
MMFGTPFYEFLRDFALTKAGIGIIGIACSGYSQQVQSN